ncbi:hypothetical protein [Allorhizobium borbori]|uniref:Uncharacterized protein n=1 Tax=Allorhizobium borbori TaxID=485907 RepID=A0A7W6P1P0_9HYPH|nr:hypothetical protein [Allorhizobium borbori]MBB4103041.1 hypothetical protein [Allorhizobium borbori]
MTTTITVKANHGWPVLVSLLNPETGDPYQPATRIEPDQERIYHATGTTDVHIHEVQPDECVHSRPYFEYSLGEIVKFDGSSRRGRVIGRTEMIGSAASYYVRHFNTFGDIQKDWFSAHDLAHVDGKDSRDTVDMTEKVSTFPDAA